MNSTLNNNISFDHQTTVNSYYNRDIMLNINNNNTIIKALQKLHYYNIDLDSEIRNITIDLLLKKISDELKSNWNSEIKNKTINDLLSNNDRVLSDNEYIQLISRYNRSLVLSRHINSSNTVDLYNDLTLDELNYLGF
jgi:hypothetical protein